ncbi:MAG: hypothetical protein ACU84Q_08030 [Gammaproteobacteria bacterium]
MSSRGSRLSLDRIAIAFADATSDVRSLEAISQLAAQSEAKISGVFIEDDEMLRAAQLPFATEICHLTNTVRPVDVSKIERHLKEHAEAARAQIESTANRLGAEWTFEVVRESLSRAVLKLARGTDVTFFATHSTLQRSRAAVTIPPQKTVEEHPIVVVVDRSASGSRSAELAQQLSLQRGLPVFALIVAASEAGAERLTTQLVKHDAFSAENSKRLLHPSFSDIVFAARKLRPSTVIVPITLIEDSPDRIEDLERELDHCILIVK